MVDNYIKHILVITFSIIIFCFSVFAQQNENEIENVAANLFTAIGLSEKVDVNQVSSVRAIKRYEKTYMYVANRTEGGWIILSNEPKYIQIIGYGRTGEFVLDSASMPPALLLLLEHHMNNIDSLRSSNDYNIKPLMEVQSITSKYIDGLLGDNFWKQSGNNSNIQDCDYSYNKFCPSFYDIYCNRTDVGCSAVAMAQIMRYWGWPDYAEIRPTIDMAGVTYGSKQKHYYDWDNMPLSINNYTTMYQVDAIAGLLRDCGYAANMIYSKAGSAAGIDKINSAMKNEFQYHTKRKHEYAWTDMKSVLINELSNNRPVICQAWSSMFSSHSFVIDGYDTGFFHINWGWGAIYNGYVDMGFNGYDANRTYLTEIYPNCIKKTDDVVVINTEIQSGENRTYYSANIVTLCEGVTIQSGGHLLVETGEQINLLPGFHAEVGSNVRLSTRDFCSDVVQSRKNNKMLWENVLAEDSNNLNNIISIFPNPVQDILTISATEPIAEIHIYNLNGQCLITSIQLEIDVSFLHQGIYLLKAVNIAGEFYQTKFIKQ